MPSSNRSRQRPPAYSCLNDPFYQGLLHDEQIARRAKRNARQAARARRLWASSPEYRERKRARRYGLTLEAYRAMLVRQQHACAICGRNDRPLVIDHCHASGRVRGLLCAKCNSLLGHADDDPARLRSAATYLEAIDASDPPAGKR